ncbi:MAG: hypothetical protein PF501_07540 [Salinisphaera sp.]|nr:hypothetical protein [Salinisphaera sp.]
MSEDLSGNRRTIARDGGANVTLRTPVRRCATKAQLDAIGCRGGVCFWARSFTHRITPADQRLASSMNFNTRLRVP